MLFMFVVWPTLFRWESKSLRCKYVCVYVYINVRCVASTHVTSFLSVQVHGASHALTCRPAGFHSEAAGAIDAFVAV